MYWIVTYGAVPQVFQDWRADAASAIETDGLYVVHLTAYMNQ